MAEIKMLSVIFSFRNEEEVLPELISRIRKVLQKEIENKSISKYELIFVNDSSDDRSVEVLLNHARGQDDIRIINMSRRFGPSPSPGVLAGMEYASGDAVVYMDADLQDPPELIPELLRVRRDNPEIEIVHTLRKSRQGESKIKLFITRIGYYILNKVTSFDLPAEAGDFKLLSRRAVDHLIKLREKKPFLRGLVCWIGFKQEFVPYDRQARFAGKTKFTVFSNNVINNFFDSALISFSAIPLKIAVFLGFLCIFVDAGVVVHVLSEKFQGRAIPGWTALMMVILFIGSIQFFCIGIMGLYLNSIFEETKGRPNYIIDSTYGFSENFISRRRQDDIRILNNN